MQILTKALTAAAVIALAAIFYYGNKKPAAPAVEPTPPVVTQPTPQNPPPKKPAQTPAVIYHRVEQDGSQGPEVACTGVKSFAEGKSSAELAVLAKQYGVSVEEVKRWYVCINE